MVDWILVLVYPVSRSLFDVPYMTCYCYSVSPKAKPILTTFEEVHFDNPSETGGEDNQPTVRFAVGDTVAVVAGQKDA